MNSAIQGMGRNPQNRLERGNALSKTKGIRWAGGTHGAGIMRLGDFCAGEHAFLRSAPQAFHAGSIHLYAVSIRRLY